MNPASRVLAAYDKAMHFNPRNGSRFLQMWGEVLGIAEKADHTNEDAITAGLMALRDEANLAMARLAEAGCPPQLYERYFNRVKEIASSTQLHQDWSKYKPGLSSDVRLALEWATWTLPDEEDEMPSDEMTTLADELDGIAASLVQAGIPPRTREFIERQIDLIRAALRLYGIKGIAPVKDALVNTLGSVAIAGAGMAQEQQAISPEGKSLIKRFVGVFDKVVKVAESADKLHKGIEAAGSLGTVVRDALTRYLPPPS